MNSSIRRPGRCLPSQGHINLVPEVRSITLADGHKVSLTRLSSSTPFGEEKGKYLHHINYYLFVGHASIKGTHLGRTLQDMYDRVLHGYVQRWAYFQVGSYWGEEIEVNEQACEESLIMLIEQLLPQQINWELIKE